ncbi:WAT1-related protein At1g43650 isoform X2 [Camellia sinensis]|uniref:WAT1-related protein At1g43650 isoform X2 n=1 Tax=Camellia sinensis TaxID=4442 RepID=UPI001035B617|nr:WAT1-related protein At1g43650 isoform X2 [Camellia sinensis]
MKSLPSFVILMDSNKPYIAMIFIQFVYAGMALFSKAAIAKGMNPFVFVVYRQAFATVVLAPLAFFIERKKSAPLSYKLVWKIFLVSLFGMESITIKQWHGVAKVLGSVLTVSGALVFAFVKGPPIKFMNNFSTNPSEIPTPSINHCNSKGDWVKGSLIMLSANTAWSLWLVMQVPVIKQYPAKLRLTTLQCFFSCIQSAVWAVAVERNASAWKLQWDVHLLSVAYCGVIVTGITYWLQVWAIEKKGPVFTAMFTPFALIITAIFSSFLWKEVLHVGSVCGAILLVGGLYGVLWGKNKEGKGETNEQKAESKEEVVLESISTHQ